MKPSEIPSEFIEPYLQNFLGNQIDGIAMGLQQPQETRNYLRGVKYFVDCYCGIHARLATSNVYDKFINLSDEDMIRICKKVTKGSTYTYD